MTEHDPDEPGVPDIRSDADRARIARDVRAHFGSELVLCERLRDVGVRAVEPGGWHGRGIEVGTIDVLIAAESARATKTYLGVLCLVLGGYGTQAMMLTRSLFEGTVIAHWATLEPETAWDRFERHGRHTEMIWGSKLESEGWQEPSPLSPIDADDRAELDKLFGKRGEKPWTGLNVWQMVQDILGLWDDDGQQLLTHARISLWNANQVLHATAQGLMGSANINVAGLGFDAFPSSTYIRRSLLTAFWCYLQTLSLLFDHFNLTDAREEVRQLSGEMHRAFSSN
ncbi:MAG TPA: DUF5677 domain-containing protein [Baekduia sp.]